jgi:molybdate transport system substrate-binding protein
MIRVVLLFLLLLPVRAADLLVAAAADLTPLEGVLKDGYRKATGERVLFTFASSGQLVHQIENGAPYDVFLSANEQFVVDAAKQGAIEPSTVRTYALGRIALWSQSGKIRSLDQLKDTGILHIAIANPAYAPYGLAARQALQKTGLWAAIQPKIVYGENVRETLQYAETGNADAAIVAWSLVYNHGGILLPDDLHEPIRQDAAVVKGARHEKMAEKFLAFLASPAGRTILREHGLMPPPPRSASGR